MKKFIFLFLIFLCLLSDFFEIITFAQLPTNVLKEGVYTVADLQVSPDNLYNITNVSSKEDAYIIIFDERYVIMQSLRLSPNIKSFNLVPLQPNNKLVVLGKTEIYIAPRPAK
ncbi:hypothetical protein [Clostridium beijerinckii]|uniref:hypothetical protein n=1 Tax=Clostridium beijerinckii TaxID=1520 RepID=UPI00098C4B5D|nr:hypothetical protein [Clostridium beijerinckii]MBA8933228.1 hypothetical protein [Clostridium beijerinckii]NRU37429.1 hypothetical protein [Clostridium beijerinckii]NSA99292.1 hypothetical protein [Clostridium beijerinckii]OOM61165.1 hypothetical protein CLOBI_27850 [Clostridium beijerinckii]OOM67682.1 hypothetical protein CLBEIC_39840 [Clostridium beijerinckii]